MEECSLYIHVPFCVRRCAYCDFVSNAGCAELREPYVRALEAELRLDAERFGGRRVNTVFFGGGTPTLLTGGQIARLMNAVRECSALAPDAEITMEGNPGTLTRENLDGYLAAGVNRLSLGVQSFDDGLLRSIGRIHTAAQAEEAFRAAREAGFKNLNLDLMYGLPGQSAAQWDETLRRAAELEPEHLSCYSLILEEGTRLEKDVREGRAAPLPDEDGLSEMDALTLRRTGEAGYTRYEVSNFAKPGRECRHNLVYWECLPYLGLGCAAHSDMDGRRFCDPDSLTEYMDAVNAGRLPHTEEPADDRAFERVMMGLRMVRGTDRTRFARDFGQTPEECWPETVREMTRAGLMESTAERLRLTARGMDVMNGVLVSMMEEKERK